MFDQDDPFEFQYRDQSESVLRIMREARRRLSELDKEVVALSLRCNFGYYDGEECPEMITSVLELLESDGLGDGGGPYCLHHLPTVIYTTGVGVM